MGARSKPPTRRCGSSGNAEKSRGISQSPPAIRRGCYSPADGRLNVSMPLQIVSFPKSGRTWLRVMLDDVGAKAGFTHDGSDHQLRQPLAALEADKSRYKGASVLLLVRDPRDTAVSGYFQVTRRLKISDATVSDVLRDERHGIKKICHFNLLWFAAARRMKPFAILS